ncbi:MAG: formate dehydrogenase subunit alpha [Anaerolineae bacterium]
MVHITIDGQPVVARQGQTVLEAARMARIHIPTLCYLERLEAIGACRLCVVEIEGIATPVTACTTPVQEGMVVTTHSPFLEEMRRETLKLLFLRHPFNCGACDINGNCQLQDLAYAYDISHQDLHDYGISPLSLGDDAWATPLIRYHPRRCVLCGRCVKACEQIAGVGCITFKGRGATTRIGPVEPTPEFNPQCVSCGECMSVCPANALVESMGRAKSKPWETRRVKTVCTYCGVGCELTLDARGDQITGVSPSYGGVNVGSLCAKGRFGYEFINHPDRLRQPLLRRNGYFAEAHWGEALDTVAERLTAIVEKHGPDAVAGLASARATNEDNYLFQKLLRGVIGTNNVDHCARLCHASTVAGLAASFGSGAMTNSIAEIEETNLILITGTNTTETHPVIGNMIKRAVQRRRAKLIVVDPQQIELVEHAHLWLRPRPGTDVAWINGLVHIILAEGLWNRQYVAERTEGFEELQQAVSAYTPEYVSQITGIPEADLLRAARMYATAGKAMILYTMGITQHTAGTDNVKALANLSLVCGYVGIEGGGLNPLRGQNNVQGACDVGALPNVYPGYQRVDDEQVLRKFERGWATGVRLSSKPGLTLTELPQAIMDGRVKALYIMGENPVLSDPNASHLAEALKHLELLVVQDIFMTETARLAHVVLPAASFAEKDGTFTNTERRVQRVRKAINPPGNAMADWEIIRDLAARLGHPMPYRTAEDVFAEMASLTPAYAGMSYERLEKGGLQWPCPDRYHPGTRILHRERFARGRAKFHAVTFRPPAELPDDEYPLVLTTGRIRYQYHTGTMTRRSRGLEHVAPEERLLVHPDDAARLGIADDDVVRVTSRRGAVDIKARVSRKPQPGLVFATFHYHEAPINRLTIDELDPVAKIPALKYCAVRVEKLLPEPEEVGR